jgi:hypothetical protein
MVMSDGERTRHPHKLECHYSKLVSFDLRLGYSFRTATVLTITDLTQVERHPYRASDIQTTTIPRTYSLAAI